MPVGGLEGEVVVLAVAVLAVAVLAVAVLAVAVVEALKSSQRENAVRAPRRGRRKARRPPTAMHIFCLKVRRTGRVDPNGEYKDDIHRTFRRRHAVHSVVSGASLTFNPSCGDIHATEEQ